MNDKKQEMIEDLFEQPKSKKNICIGDKVILLKNTLQDKLTQQFKNVEYDPISKAALGNVGTVLGWGIDEFDNLHWTVDFGPKSKNIGPQGEYFLCYDERDLKKVYSTAVPERK